MSTISKKAYADITFKQFYKEGKRIVYDYDAIVREKKKYKGAE